MYSTRIKNIYSDLTGSEMKIADYIFANKGNIKEMTSIEFAELLDIGQSTIIRFSQKLGYKNFKQFLFDVINDTSDEEKEVQVTDTSQITLEKIKDRYKSLLDNVHDINSYKDYDAVVGLFYKADNVITYGFLGSGGFASYLSESLIEMGIKSYFDNSITKTKQQISFCKTNDVLVVISKSGETNETIDLVKFAKKRGLKIVSVTSLTKNQLTEISDYHLNILMDNMNTRLHSYSSSVELVYIIDSLILLVYKKDFINKRKNIEEYRGIVRPD